MHLHTLSTYYNCYVFEQEPVPCTFSSIHQPRESIRFVSRSPCRVPSLQYNNHVNRFVFVSRNPCRVPSLQYYNLVNRFVLFPETRAVYLRFNTTTTWIDAFLFPCIHYYSCTYILSACRLAKPYFQTQPFLVYLFCRRNLSWFWKRRMKRPTECANVGL